MTTLKLIQAFADVLSAEQKAEIVANYGADKWPIHQANYTAHVHMGKKFDRVDVGGSGKYMVDMETGVIYGVKGYGVAHRGHVFGTLDTIADWIWSGYRAHHKNAGAAIGTN